MHLYVYIHFSYIQIGLTSFLRYKVNILFGRTWDLRSVQVRDDLSFTKSQKRHTPLFWVDVCLCGWDRSPVLSVWNTAYVCPSLSLRGVHQGAAIPLLTVGLWSCTCQRTRRETQRDSLIGRQRGLAFELDLFLFFHLPLSCHMAKAEPSGGMVRKWHWEV